jgi:endonuclease VIII
VPVAEFLTGAAAARSRDLAALGPDLLADDFDRTAALARIRANAEAAISDVLLNQRVVSGIGNVFKSEILFVARVFPFSPVRDLDDDAIGRIIEVALRLMRANVGDPSRTLAPTRDRWTTGRMNPAERLWVYGRARRPCRQCAAPIAVRRTGVHARPTYWCPSCQRPARPAADDGPSLS